MQLVHFLDRLKMRHLDLAAARDRLHILDVKRISAAESVVELKNSKCARAQYRWYVSAGLEMLAMAITVMILKL